MTTEQVRSLETQLQAEQSARLKMETEIAQLKALLQESMES